MMHPGEEHPVHRAVREHLDREAAKVDGRAMRDRVRAQVPDFVSVPPRRMWRRGVALGAGAAVAAGFALYYVLGGTGPVEPQVLGAAELIREAKAVH